MRFRPRSNPRWSIVSAVALVAAGWASATALLSAPPSAKPGAKPLEPEKKSVQTQDGATIHLTYYKSPRGKDAPVVVLLHMKDGNQLVWQGKNGLAERLWNTGFAVITVDLRRHGASQPGVAAAGNINQDGKKKDMARKAAASELRPADYQAMYDQDMRAVKKFIYTEHQAENLNMNKMGIVGPEMGATIAAYYAALDWDEPPHPDARPGMETPNGQDVRALVLISPRQTFPGLPMQKAINLIRAPAFKIAFLFCVGKDDPQDSGHQTKKLYEQAGGLAKDKDDRIYFQEYSGKLRGTDLLGRNLKIEEQIITFLNKHLMQLEAPWRDRESKLNK